MIYDYYLLASFKLYSLNIDQPGSLLLHSKIFFHTAALGLKCEAGCKITSDVPDSEKACDGMKSGVFTCDRFLDRCMTTKVRITGPFRGFSSDMEIKNCSNSFVCEPSSDFNCNYKISMKATPLTIINRPSLLSGKLLLLFERTKQNLSIARSLQ